MRIHEYVEDIKDGRLIYRCLHCDKKVPGDAWVLINVPLEQALCENGKKVGLFHSFLYKSRLMEVNCLK